MDLNIINIMYMFFRLAPFIIVSYFTLQSLFNQDMKGVIYIIGLIVASFVTVILGGILKNSPHLKVLCQQIIQELDVLN